MKSRSEPVIIQGGMGVGVSTWRLARAVSRSGQLGVVSGTALDAILSRRLQLGDPGGHMRRALAAFPFPEMADRVLRKHFIPGGKAADAPFRAHAVVSQDPPAALVELLVTANFAEVFLAKQGHDGLVGVNYLEKVQPPTLPSLFGAMLADVDYVLMGAGIPRAIPGILDRLHLGEPVEIPLNVAGAGRDEVYVSRFDPVAFCGGRGQWVERPKFLAIIASATLATVLAKKASGRVDGFVIEGPTAGGHNAPPRGALRLNDRGEPLYGDRDIVDLDAIEALGRPFWLAGSCGTPQDLADAIQRGAAGVQVGTAFAFCDESGLDPEIKERVRDMARRGAVDVRTDPSASPTGFPFKVLSLSDSLSEAAHFEQRSRVCDLGYLRHAYRRDDGSLGWRCPSEPVEDYVRKGGDLADTCGRKCVCNGLMANIGVGQLRRDGLPELPLVTTGDAVSDISRFLPTPGATSYSADDVVSHLLSGLPPVADQQSDQRAPQAAAALVD
jgi:nitronate monooxygenase